MLQRRKIYQKNLIKGKKIRTDLFTMIIGNLNIRAIHLLQKLMRIKCMPIKLSFLVCR